METTLAVYEDVVRKVLAADGVARTVATAEFVALVAAVADGRLIVNVRRTLAAATSKVTAAGGTPACVATVCVSSSRTVDVKSETDPATTTVVETDATVGGRGGGGGDGDGGGGDVDGGGGGGGDGGRCGGKGGGGLGGSPNGGAGGGFGTGPYACPGGAGGYGSAASRTQRGPQSWQSTPRPQKLKT